MNTSRLLIMLLLLTYIPAMARTLTVAYYDNPPKIYKDDAGKPAGLFYDILKKVADEEKWNLKYVYGTWENCLESVSSGRIDLIPDIGYSPERATYFTFSEETIFINWGGLFYREGQEIQKISELEHKKIAVVKGCIHTEGSKGIKAILAEKEIDAELIEVDSYREALKIVAQGFADVAAVNQLIGERYKKGFKLVSSSAVYNPIELRFAMAKSHHDDAQVLATIDRQIRQMKTTTVSGAGTSFQEIVTQHLNSWKPEHPRASALYFTPEEKYFISEHPELRVAVDPQLAPIEFVDEKGVLKGISSDLLRLLSTKTGILFTPVQTANWHESMQLLHTNEIDLFSFITPTLSRKQKLSFTTPYQRFPAMIFARSDQHYMANISQLRKKKICVIRGYAMTELLSKEGYLENSVTVENIEEALLALARGDADVYIGFILPTTYAMKKLGLSNIKIVGETPIQTEFSMAVRKDLKPLHSILNKSLASISDEEWNNMYHKWNSVTFEQGIDYRLLWQVVGFSTVILLLFVLWILSLRREIQRRKKVEEELKEQTSFKNSLIQMIVHDMRSPLQVITSFIDILRIEEENIAIENLPDITAISKTTHSLIGLVNDVIDTQKMEEIGLALSKEEVDLGTILEETFTKMSVLRQDVKCSLLLPASLQKAHCDSFIIGRVIQNLLGNSLKYTESLVALSVIEEERSFRIEIVDDGPGIPEEYHDHVFEKFGRVYCQKQKDYSTGLGLTFCKLAVEEHGGSIGVVSKSGQGSCFWFTIPMSVNN